MIEVAVFEDALGLHIEVRDDENERGLATTIATEVLNDPQVEGDHLIAAAVAYLTWLLFLMLEAFRSGGAWGCIFPPYGIDGRITQVAAREGDNVTVTPRTWRVKR